MNGSAARRDRLILIGGLVLILVVVAVGLGGLHRLAATSDDWRIEQYREVVFQVPGDWGYADEPGRTGVVMTGRIRVSDGPT